MPRSQTPVVSRPLAMSQTGLLPSGHWISSAFRPVARTYLLTTTIHFSELNSAACVLASPLLRTPSLDDRTSVWLPTRWLTVGRVGLIGCCRRTHWVTMTSFKGCHPYSNVPSFSRHEQRMVRPAFITKVRVRPSFSYRKALSWYRANAPEVVRARRRAVCKQQNPTDSHGVRLLADPIDRWRQVEGTIQSVPAGRVTGVRKLHGPPRRERSNKLVVARSVTQDRTRDV